MAGTPVIRQIGQGEIIRSGIAHARIINEYTGEDREVQINPTQIQERLRVNYSEEHAVMKVPGDLVYGNTGNTEIPLRLELDQELFPKTSIIDFWLFVKSLCYPVRLGDLIGDPPDVLFVWPHLFSIQVKVTSLQTTFNDFTRALKPKSYVMNITVKETGYALVFSSDVREKVQVLEPVPESFLPGQGEWF